MFGDGGWHVAAERGLTPEAQWVSALEQPRGVHPTRLNIRVLWQSRDQHQNHDAAAAEIDGASAREGGETVGTKA